MRSFKLELTALFPSTSLVLILQSAAFSRLKSEVDRLHLFRILKTREIVVSEFVASCL